MTPPKINYLAFAVLEFAKNGRSYNLDEIRTGVAKAIEFSVESSQTQNADDSAAYRGVFRQRLSQAVCYLRRAGMLERRREGGRGRALFSITPVGEACLKSGPESDTLCAAVSAAKQSRRAYPRNRRSRHSPSTTPSQILADAFMQAQQGLVPDILKELRRSHEVFSKVAAEIVKNLVSAPVAAKKGKPTVLHSVQGPRLMDKGVLVHIAPEAGGNVDRAQIESFVAHMTEKRAQRGFFISAGSIEPSARAYAATAGKNITPLTIDDVAWLMLEFGMGVKTVATYEIKEVDSSFFSVE
jgi:restriction system protein